MSAISVTFRPERASHFTRQGWWRDETLSLWLDRWAEQKPDRPALRTASASEITYAELRHQARRFAAALRSLGIGKGDVVAAQLPNGPEFVVCYLAAGLCRAVFQTVHMPYRAAEIETLLGHSGAKIVIALATVKDFAAAQTMLDLRERIVGLRHVVAVGPQPPAGALPMGGLLETSTSAEQMPPPAPDDPFLLLYTSGTTSAPKGVPVTYRNFLSNARMSTSELQVDATSVLLSAAPFTHLYGLFSINLALAAGACSLLLPAFTPPDLAAILDRGRPTGLFTAPSHVAACYNAGVVDRERLSSLRFAMISGSVCPPELARALQRDLSPDGKVLQLWGMSELQAGSYTRPGDDWEVRASTAGRASPGTELRVAAIAGDVELSAGHEGELQVRGCSLFAGYLDNADADAMAFSADGWFRTGDLAVMDPGGNIRITGRLKELINRGGIKYNPTDVEALIDRHPSVQQSAVVPLPDPVLGERACCFVVLKPDAASAFTLDEVRSWLLGHEVGKLKWPERLEIIDAMPLTPTRKIIKGELVRRLLAMR